MILLSFERKIVKDWIKNEILLVMIMLLMA